MNSNLYRYLGLEQLAIQFTRTHVTYFECILSCVTFHLAARSKTMNKKTGKKYPYHQENIYCEEARDTL